MLNLAVCRWRVQLAALMHVRKVGPQPGGFQEPAKDPSVGNLHVQHVTRAAIPELQTFCYNVLVTGLCLVTETCLCEVLTENEPFKRESALWERLAWKHEGFTGEARLCSGDIGKLNVGQLVYKDGGKHELGDALSSESSATVALLECGV